MSLLHVLRPSFSGGEADPALCCRSDLDKFNTFLKKCRNFFVHPQGGASNRAGTFFLASTKNPAQKSRLIPFEFSTTNCYVMEFGEGYIRFFTAGGVVLDADGRPYEIATPYAETDLPKIHYAQSADVVYLACEGIRPKMLTRYGHANWTFEDYPFKNGPYLPYDGEAKGKLVKTSDTQKVEMMAVDYSNNVYISADGKKWELNNNLSVGNGKIIYANNLFLKVQDGAVHSSRDCQIWVREGNMDEDLKDIVYGAGYYVGYSRDKIWYSSDLETWNSVVLMAQEGESLVKQSYISALAYVNNLFVAATASSVFNGKYLYSAQSPNLWTKKSVTFNGSIIEDIYYLDGKYLFNPTFMYSTDLTSLKYFPSSASNRTPTFFYVANGVGIGFIPSNQGTDLTTSTDGLNWTKIGSSPMGISSNEKLFTADYYNGYYYFTWGSGMIRGNLAEGFSVVLVSQALNLQVKRAHIESVPQSQKLVSLNYKFAPEMYGRKFKIQKEFAASSITHTFRDGNSPAVYSDIVLAGSGWLLQTHGTWSGEVRMEVSKDKVNWSVYRSFSSQNDSSNYNVTGNFDGDIYFVRITAAISGMNKSVYVDFTAYSFSTYIYLSATGYESENTALVECDADTQYIKDYIDEKEGNLYIGAWSEASGWPASVCIYQGRVCWGKDFTIDATKVEEYTNFGVSIPLTDSDAISTNVRAGGLNAIVHLVGGSNLLAFTSGGEFASTSDVFTPSACGMSKQTNRGASLPAPVIIGQRIIYAQAMGTALRDFAYNFESDGYDGDDLCVLSRHLFAGRRVEQMAYQQEPDSLLWVLLSDGTLLCCTYMREQEVLAWSQMQTDGAVESICSIPGDNQNDLYLIVRRGDGRFVERMAPRLPSFKPQDQVFLDACVRYEGEPVRQITGLEHLEGREVGVLADGAPMRKQVVENGCITLEAARGVAVVGLPYTCELETMPVDTPLQDGTMQDRKTRPCKLFLTVANTVGAFVGQAGQELDEVLFKEWADGVNRPSPLKSGTYEVSLSSRTQYNPTITIQKRTPLPITVLGLTVQQRV